MKAEEPCHQSIVFFPGHTVLLYPQVIERTARKIVYPHIGPWQINPGGQYYLYRPFIEDLTDKKRYTLQTSILAECQEQDLFPQTFQELELLHQQLEQAYEISDEFYQLSRRLGHDGLILQELKDDPETRRKRRIKRKLKELLMEEKTLLQMLPYHLYPNEIQKQLDEIHLNQERLNQALTTTLLKQQNTSTRQKSKKRL